jgi:XTP/dITP diphosphohydrolase
VVRLLIATRNAHKTREIQEILGDQFEVHDLSAHPEIPETIESGKTFKENAVLKAVAVSKESPELVIADDSGLEVDALGGAPGIFSARYAGENATGQENIDKLLGELTRTGGKSSTRSARFRCALALAHQKGEVLATFDSAVEGMVIDSPRGSKGFGYDPIFVPSGFKETFAELPDETKNRISHRAKALEKLKRYLKIT